MIKNKTILIAPFARQLRNGKENAKNYPFAKELVVLLKQNGFHTIQIGVSEERDIEADERKNNLPIEELEKLIKDSFILISVDSMAQHLAWYVDKPCICLWGLSDPAIFGHPENINLLKDKKNLRSDPWHWWENIEVNKEAFVSPETILRSIQIRI